MLKESVLNSIQYQITAKEESIPIIHEAQEYFYPDGRMNHAIPNDLLRLLPLHWQRYAYRLDFEKLFPQIEESIEDAIELSEDSKNLIRSITLAEIQARGEKEE